jgi:hypothetical protein
MNILILSITINWVYRLYEEYIISLKKFIDIYYKKYNIKINIFYINSLEFNIDKLTIINSDYDKILYSGDISIFNNIYNKYYNLKNIFYYINIEQLSKDSYFKMLHNIDSSIKIIDYSEENLLYLNKLYTHYLYPPFFKKFNIDISNKYIDVLSITNNNYRQNIFKNIILDKKYEKISIDNIYGSDRDEIFNNTKIYINIHSSEDHKTMELIRLNNLIMRKVIILSQDSININLLFFKDYIIKYNSIEDLNIKVNNILNNYSYYYNMIYSNFNEKEKEYVSYIKKNIDKILF